MTSEYDELLARLDGESADYRGDWSSVGDAAAAIRALTAQVEGLADERDAASESASSMTRWGAEQRVRADQAEAQVVERDAVIEEWKDWASADGMDGMKWTTWYDRLLERSGTDALAARDAARDKTVRATALRDAARAIVNGDEPWSIDPAEPWLAARADQEEL